MSSNLTSYACFDSTGLVWTSVYDGLVSYDGTRMQQYLSETHPGLTNNVIDFLYCDSRNRIWICSVDGLSLLDEQRHMTKVVISDTLKDKDVNQCIEVPGLGMLAICPNRCFLLPLDEKKWQPYTWLGQDIIKGQRIEQLVAFNKKLTTILTNKDLLVVDLAAQKIIMKSAVTNAARIVKINEDELLTIHSGDITLQRINIHTGAITKKYEDIKDQHGNTITTQVVSADMGADGIVYITTRTAGLVSFDPVTGRTYDYMHQPLIKTSISSSSLRRVICHRNGYMIITSTTGLNYTNLLIPVLEQRNKFADEKGNVVDNVNMAGEDVNNKIWVGSINWLLIWDPVTDKVKNITPDPFLVPKENANIEAASIFRDHNNNMWVSYNGKGLAKFDSEGRMLKFLSAEENKLPTNRIRIIRQLDNDMLVLGAEDGFFMMHPGNFSIDTFNNDPLLKAIRNKRVINFMPDGDKLWIASSTRGAAYCYDFKKKNLLTYNSKNGLSSDRVYCITKDHQNNIYIGTYDGLNILSPGGKIRFIGKHNGLRQLRVDNLVTDEEGRIWITNFNTLICYDPADSSFAYYDEQNGVSNAGFAVGQSVLTKDGKLLFCNNGLLIADTKKTLPLQPWSPEVFVNRLYDDGGYDLLDPSQTVNLKYNNSKISLYYMGNSLVASNRFFYRYKMEGLDTGWSQPTKNNQVTYNLKTGHYTFRIQSSYNEGGWKESSKKIHITVSPPWWQTWWFYMLAFVVVAGGLYIIYRSRVKAIKTRAAIKQQMTELEGKALRAQMNPHFIFNSLNAIQELIVTKNIEEGYQYLSQFSKLLRMVLNNSEKNVIPLASELEMIRLQLSLESLRFKRSFNYHIDIERSIEPELISVPPLLLQPYVENAVWHGLRTKEGEKNLWIRIKEKENKLEISIEDDGVGRQKAEEIRKQKLGAEQFESKGSILSQQRIKILDELYPAGATVTIIDLKNEKQEATGTEIKISLPINLR